MWGLRYAPAEHSFKLSHICLTGEQLGSTSACPSVSFVGLWEQSMLFRGEDQGLRQLPYLDLYSEETKRVGKEGLYFTLHSTF